MPVVSATAFDHLVVRCADVERTLAWYLDLLGLAPVRVDEWRRGEAPFPSVRVDETTIIDLIGGLPDVADPSGGAGSRDGRLDHICLVIEPVDLVEIAASGAVVVLEGPVRRFGARGDGTSLYVRDPDGLVVELRHYG
jgi:catechol 2,3-dioxygenase-like lactoylglutathione lyase family enzyme